MADKLCDPGPATPGVLLDSAATGVVHLVTTPTQHLLPRRLHNTTKCLAFIRLSYQVCALHHHHHFLSR